MLYFTAVFRHGGVHVALGVAMARNESLFTVSTKHFTETTPTRAKYNMTMSTASWPYKVDKEAQVKVLLERQYVMYINMSVLGDLPVEMGFQPDLQMEFPTVNVSKPRIPHILHQIWITHGNHGNNSVPRQFVNNVKTFMIRHPGWKYAFWTHETGRKLIAKWYPQLLPFYDNANQPVTKSDILRYAIIHAYGGVYVDLDVTCHRNLNIVTTKYACILVPAPFENAVTMLQWPYHICNGVILCRANHPFFTQVLQAISKGNTHNDDMLAYGPHFFTRQYRRYNNITNMYRIDIKNDTTTPYFYKGSLPDTHTGAIYVPNTRYFLDQPFPPGEEQVNGICKNVSAQTDIERRMCVDVKRRGFNRTAGQYTFLTHGYAHTFGDDNRDKKRTFMSVQEIVQSIYNNNRTTSANTNLQKIIKVKM